MKYGLFYCLLAVLAGCGTHAAKPTTQPANLSDRSNKALSDPFDYSPDFDRTNISGGDIGTMDKNGMKKDLDHVFNP
jgi:hypothetical protein